MQPASRPQNVTSASRQFGATADRRVDFRNSLWRPDSPFLADFLTADDVAHAIVTVLQQPRRVRTTLWSLWSMGQQS